MEKWDFREKRVWRDFKIFEDKFVFWLYERLKCWCVFFVTHVIFSLDLETLHGCWLSVLDHKNNFLSIFISIFLTTKILGVSKKDSCAHWPIHQDQELCDIVWHYDLQYRTIRKLYENININWFVTDRFTQVCFSLQQITFSYLNNHFYKLIWYSYLSKVIVVLYVVTTGYWLVRIISMLCNIFNSNIIRRIICSHTDLSFQSILFFFSFFFFFFFFFPLKNHLQILYIFHSWKYYGAMINEVILF